MPIMVVILNNQGYLSETAIPCTIRKVGVQRPIRFGDLDRACPDYAVLAQAFGAHGEKVEEPSDVRSALVERGLRLSVWAGLRSSTCG